MRRVSQHNVYTSSLPYIESQGQNERHKTQYNLYFPMGGFGAEYNVNLLSLIRGRLICGFTLWLLTLNSCGTPRLLRQLPLDLRLQIGGTPSR